MFSIDVINNYALQIVEYIKEAPALVSGLVIFVSMAIEYVFPPYPGDVIAAAAGFFAARGAISWVVAALALILGSLAGASLSWKLGEIAAHKPAAKRYVEFFISPKNLQRLHDSFERYGTFLLLGNRFLPVIRGAILFCSGLAGVSYKKIAICSSISAVFINGVLVFLGYFVSNNFEELLELMQSYSKIIIIIMAALLVLIIARRLWSKFHNDDGSSHG